MQISKCLTMLVSCIVRLCWVNKYWTYWIICKLRGVRMSSSRLVRATGFDMQTCTVRMVCTIDLRNTDIT